MIVDEEATVIQPATHHINRTQQDLPLPAPSEKRTPLFPDQMEHSDRQDRSYSLENGLQKMSVDPPQSLMAAAAPILSIMATLRYSQFHQDVVGLHHALIQECKQFDQQCKRLRIKQEQRITARYLLCAGLDEAVLNTPWGIESGWAQRPLLSIFHHETAGGEKVFLIIAKMLEVPERNKSLIELSFSLLMMGFEGQFRFKRQRGHELSRIRDRLYRSIQTWQSDKSDQPLVPTIEVKRPTGIELTRYLPIRMIALLFVLLLMIGYLGFQFTFSSLEASLMDGVEQTQQALKMLSLGP